ncbi:ribosomal protein S18-alanine N-acetyltransferase [Thermodesulfovibrio hydrogeniphilus]
MNIRLAEARDLPSIHHIAIQSFSSPWSMKSFAEELSNPNSRVKVVEVEGEIVGYVVYRMISDEAEILSIAIKPEQRRKGLAKELIKNILDEIKHKARSCFLEVRASNIPAIKLYEKMGFQKKGLRKNYYLIPEEDAIIMELRL